MFEVLTNKLEQIKNSDIITRLNLIEKGYFLVSAHREENINSEQNFLDLVDSLNLIAEIYQLPLIVSTHPRTRKMIEEKAIQFNPLITLLKP